MRGVPAPEKSLETKIESGVLSVRFDEGHRIVLDVGAKAVLQVEDLGGSPRAGRVVYRNEWGLTQTQQFHLRAPKRLG